MEDQFIMVSDEANGEKDEHHQSPDVLLQLVETGNGASVRCFSSAYPVPAMEGD